MATEIARGIGSFIWAIARVDQAWAAQWERIAEHDKEACGYAGTSAAGKK